MVSASLFLIRTAVAPSFIESSAAIISNHVIGILGALQIWYQSQGFKGHCELSSVYELAIKVCMSYVRPVK